MLALYTYQCVEYSVLSFLKAKCSIFGGESISKHSKRPKQSDKGQKIKSTRQNNEGASSDAAKKLLKKSRYENQAEEGKDSHTAYSDAAETQVDAVGKALLTGKNKLRKKKAKTKESVEEGLAQSTIYTPKPKTAGRQKVKLALERREKAGSKQIGTGKKKLQIKQIAGKAKTIAQSNKQGTGSKPFHTTSSHEVGSHKTAGGVRPPLSYGKEPRENPLVTKSKKKFPKQRVRGFTPKIKSIVNMPKTKQSLGIPSPLSKSKHIAKSKARKKAEGQLRQRAIERAKIAVKKTVDFAKKVVLAAAKATKAFVTSLATLVGGGSVIALLLIVAVVGAIVSSPFGLFYSGEDKTPKVKPITSVVQKINEEFDDTIATIIHNNSSVDEVIIHYEGSNDGVKINNWPDVITIFAINTTMKSDDSMDVVTIDTKRVDLIQDTFHTMNLVEYEIEENETTDDEGNATDTEYILHITITSKSAWDMAEELEFDRPQREVLEEMMGGQLRPELMKLLGISDEGLTPEEIEEILANLPEGDVGAAVIQMAMTRLGDPYSIPKRGQGNYTDCSHLTMWSYEQLGVTIPPTASTQAKFLYDNDMTVDQSDLQPGDFVFWSYGPSDKFMNIGHCGFYIGGGQVIHASSYDMKVVIEPLFHQDRIVFFARLDN